MKSLGTIHGADGMLREVSISKYCIYFFINQVSTQFLMMLFLFITQL